MSHLLSLNLDAKTIGRWRHREAMGAAGKIERLAVLYFFTVNYDGEITRLKRHGVRFGGEDREDIRRLTACPFIIHGVLHASAILTAKLDSQ